MRQELEFKNKTVSDFLIYSNLNDRHKKNKININEITTVDFCSITRIEKNTRGRYSKHQWIFRRQIKEAIINDKFCSDTNRLPKSFV